VTISLDEAWRALKEARPASGLDEADRRRFAFAASLAVGRSILDVGTGDGVFAYALASSGDFDTVTAMDIKPYAGVLMHPRATFVSGSIAERNLSLAPHDTVFCMEVIEHLTPQNAALALDNLRRASARRLVVSVPYNEPEPLWHSEKPWGHKQSFSFRRLAALFPAAVGTLLPRYGVDWVFLVEDFQRRPSEFRMLPRKQFSAFFDAAA
jgi:SAM-dependent methyltransferase